MKVLEALILGACLALLWVIVAKIIKQLKILSNMFTLSIKGRVMQVIKTRIANAQKKYEEELNTLENDYQEEVKTLAASHELNKENLFEKHVAGVLKGFNM